MSEFAVIRLLPIGSQEQATVCWNDTADEAIEEAELLNSAGSGNVFRAVESLPTGYFKSLTGESLYVEEVQA